MYAVFLRQVYLYRETPIRFFQMFVWVLIDLVLWGFISKYFSQSAVSPSGIVTILLSAIILWGFLNRVYQGLIMFFLEDSWSRNFLNMFATPLKLYEYVAGFVVSTIITSAIVFAVVIPLAYVMFGYSLLTLGFSLVPFIIALFIFGVSIGIFSVALVLRFGPVAEWFIWPVAAITGPFVGVFYPISTLPEWMHIISYALPPTYVFEGMRAVIGGGAFSFSNALTGLALAFVYVFISYITLSCVFRIVIRNGQIARFGTEAL